MFSNYFTNQTSEIQKALAKNIKTYANPAPSKPKNLKLYDGFYSFLRKHLPYDFFLATGRVRNKKQILNRDCDLLIYKKWCEEYLKLNGGYVLSEDLYAFFSIITNLDGKNLTNHMNLTRALKSLYTDEPENALIPIYSILFSYTSSRSLLFWKQSLQKLGQKKEISANQQVDVLCVLGKGIIVKNWEDKGDYLGIETKKDTLMWFYIILMEYLDREGKMHLNLRDYIKQNREYDEC